MVTEFTAQDAKSRADSKGQRDLTKSYNENMEKAFNRIKEASFNGETNVDLDIYETEEVIKKLMTLALFAVNAPNNCATVSHADIIGFDLAYDKIPHEQKALFSVITRLLELGYKVSKDKRCYIGNSMDPPKYYLNVDWSFE